MAFFLPACASTLGNINGVSGWAKLIALISVPNFVVLMIAIPFITVSAKKGMAARKIAVRILVYETLAAGAIVALLCFFFFFD
jgi:hypothetical protein